MRGSLDSARDDTRAARDDTRDLRIVLFFVGSIPTLILSLATLCTYAISAGASMRWRLLFRLMCHGKPERCFELFGVPMPICARCTGIYLGVLAGLAAWFVVRRVSEKTFKRVALVALIPMAIDGLTQLTGLRESTNTLRVATGLVAGLAFGLWILAVAQHRDETVFTAS